MGMFCFDFLCLSGAHKACGLGMLIFFAVF